MRLEWRTPYVLHCSRIRRDICANCFCSCDILGAHLHGSKTCNRQAIRAEPQIIFAVVTCAVPGLSVFYSLVVSIWKPCVCAIRCAHLLGSTARKERDIRADCFCSCKLRCCRVCFTPWFYRAVWYFFSYDCLVVALSVSCTCFLGWSADSLKSVQWHIKLYNNE